MRSRITLYHFLFWTAVYLLWIAVFRSYTVSLTKTMTIEFCYLIFITADYYAISYYIIPRFLLVKKYGLFISAIVLLIAFSGWLRALVAVQMNAYFFHPAAKPDFTSLYINSVSNITLWVLLITAGKMILDKKKSEHELELLEKEKTKNELDYLKAQINPHALFNSLNTVYGRIDKSNKPARDTLLQFSELLRYQLYDCNSEKVSLQKEISYIRNYVAFHQLRKDENLVLDIKTEGCKDDLQIAPLLLIVLIENAFKYVSNSSETENKISIRLHTDTTKLHTAVFNTTEPKTYSPNGDSNGIGLVNFRRRLDLLYKDKYEFTYREEKNFYETNLILDLS